jgi:hypothetical protein
MGTLQGRDELQKKRDELESSLPGLVQLYPDQSQFLLVFSGAVDAISDGLEGEDFDWLTDQLDGMLDALCLTTQEEPLPAVSARPQLAGIRSSLQRLVSVFVIPESGTRPLHD